MLPLLQLAARLPLPLLHALGAVLGWAVYVLSPRYRRYLKSNLEIAGLRGLRLRAAVIAEGGKSAMEIPAIWLRSHEQAAALVVEAKGWEDVEKGARAGHGLIFVTPHLGCWEAAGQYVASRMPITVMSSRNALSGIGLVLS